MLIVKHTVYREIGRNHAMLAKITTAENKVNNDRNYNSANKDKSYSFFMMLHLYKAFTLLPLLYEHI